MSDLRVTSLGFEALVLASEEPKPIPLQTDLGIPINPMLFRANWSSEIRLKTRWVTDVTRPDKSNRTERWSLLSRPSRSLSVTLTGLSKDESEAMLQAARQHTRQHGVPVPLYPDAVAIKEPTELGGPRQILIGDFSRRRFFRGGRVVIYPADPTAVRSDAVFFAVVVAVSPGFLEVDAIPRAVLPSDSVAPCIDVEIAPKMGGTALTDSVWEASMDWTEVEGECSLPALWPAVVSGDSSSLAPFCSILDNLAVFPFEPNWEGGVGVDIVREMDSSPSGRGLVKNPNGDPAHVFSMSLMGYNRERTWNIVRFFDAMRGRAGSFYLIHPLRPWRAYSPMVNPLGLTQVRIYSAGDRFAIEDGVRKVVLARADGSMVTRDIESVTDNGSYFDLIVNPALPDENFVSVQPIFVCSFDQDEIEEAWSTNEVVPSISVTIQENPSPGDVSASNQQSFQFPLSDHAFQSIPGLNLLLRAGAGCYSPSGALCSAWPGNSTVARWVDESAGPARDSRPRDVLKQMLPLFSSPPPSLVRFPSTFDNNKQTTIIAGGFSLGYQLDPATPTTRRSLWASDGWTLFLCFTPLTVNLIPPADRDLVRIEEASGICFRLMNDTDPIRAIANRSLLQIKDGAGVLQVINPDALNYRTFTTPVVVCIRVDATHVRFWLNGAPATSSAFPLPAGMWASNNYTVSNWFPGISSTNVPSSAVLRAAWGNEGGCNLVASYGRALSLEETRYVNNAIISMFRSGSSTLAFY